MSSGRRTGAAAAKSDDARTEKNFMIYPAFYYFGQGSIGDVAVYHRLIDLDIPLVRSNTDATQVTLTAKYQGCADRGICYPPQQQVFTLDLPAGSGAASVAVAQIAAPPAAGVAVEGPAPAQAKQSEQDEIASMMAGKSTWVVIGAFFLIGLGLAFTPCVRAATAADSGSKTARGWWCGFSSPKERPRWTWASW